MSRPGSTGPIGRAGLIVTVLSTLLVLAGSGPSDATPAADPPTAPCSAPSRAHWQEAGGACVAAVENAVAVVELVVYPSTGGETVGGIVCRPKGTARNPVIVINRGGFGPLADDDLGSCIKWASPLGYVALLPMYRDPGAAPLDDSLCEAEVDDMLRMVAIGRAQPTADPERLVMYGVSHGGCVTLRGLQRGVPGLDAVATLSAPTEMRSEHQHLDAAFDNVLHLCPLLAGTPGTNCWGWLQLRTRMEQAMGGPPSPETLPAYARRSVVSDVLPLSASSVPILIGHGVDDAFVPVGQSCLLVAALDAVPATAPRFASFHMGAAAGAPLTGTRPRGCPWIASWPTSGDPRPAGFPGSRYLFVYEGAGHGDGAGFSALEADAARFLVAKTPQ